MNEYRKTDLGNGVRVVTESYPRARGVSVGFWVDAGTRYEPKGLEGVSHFIEHMVFKRTKTRSAYQIAKALEEVGGELNAFTSREHTCFYTHSLHEHLELSVEVLSDLLSQPLFLSDDLRKERSVVLQEIRMADDMMEDHIYDLFFSRYMKGHGLAVPILGTEESLKGMNTKNVKQHFATNYRGEAIVVSAAGRLRHEDVVRHVEKYLHVESSRRKQKTVAPKYSGFRAVKNKSAEQVHILMGLPSTSYVDRHRFESYIVNTLLGGGMTSRLYQKVREDKGLAYSVYSQLTTYTDSGVNLIYAGTEADNVRKVTEIMATELERLKKYGIKRAELDLYKTQVLGQIELGADDVENRMNSLAVNELVFGKYRSVEQVVKEIQAVSLHSIRDYIDRFFDFDKVGLVLLGQYQDQKTDWMAKLF